MPTAFSLPVHSGKRSRCVRSSPPRRYIEARGDRVVPVLVAAHDRAARPAETGSRECACPRHGDDVMRGNNPRSLRLLCAPDRPPVRSRPRRLRSPGRRVEPTRRQTTPRSGRGTATPRLNQSAKRSLSPGSGERTTAGTCTKEHDRAATFRSHPPAGAGHDLVAALRWPRHRQRPPPRDRWNANASAPPADRNLGGRQVSRPERHSSRHHLNRAPRDTEPRGPPPSFARRGPVCRPLGPAGHHHHQWRGQASRQPAMAPTASAQARGVIGPHVRRPAAAQSRQPGRGREAAGSGGRRARNRRASPRRTLRHRLADRADEWTDRRPGSVQDRRRWQTPPADWAPCL